MGGTLSCFKRWIWYVIEINLKKKQVSWENVSYSSTSDMYTIPLSQNIIFNDKIILF